MEIGLDYMHMRSRAQHHGLRWAGIGILLTGIGLVLAGGIYYGYIFSLRAELDDLAAQRQDVALIPGTARDATATEANTVSALALQGPAHRDQILEMGFIPLMADQAAAPGTQTPATRLTLGTLGIDVKVDETHVTGASLVNFASGINPAGTSEAIANPGERGSTWFFGPSGKTAGSFAGLTKAPEKLAAGEAVFIAVSNGSQDYLYLGTHTDVVKSAELQLSSTDLATVHLAVPVPAGLYDHFLVLSGELVGMR